MGMGKMGKICNDSHRKISRRDSRSSDNAELGHFTLFFFAEEGKEMYKDLQRTCTAIILLITSFVRWRSRCRCPGLLELQDLRFKI